MKKLFKSIGTEGEPEIITQGDNIKVESTAIHDGLDDTILATIIKSNFTGALVTQDLTELKKSCVNIYGDANIAPNAEVTLCTYTVPAGKVFYFSGFVSGGQADGLFTAKVNGTNVCRVRNSASARTLFIWFKNDIRVSAGGTVDVIAKNIWVTPPTASARDFESTLNGYLMNI